MNHNVPTRGDFPAMQPDHLAQAPPNSIALHGVSQRFLDAPSEAAEGQPVGSHKDRYFAARPAAAFAVHRVVLGSVQQPVGAREIKPWPFRRV
jgi:hypothetical protein